MARKHAPGARRAPWTITVVAKNGEHLFHAECEDGEAQALAAEARHNGGQAIKIWLRDPYNKLIEWV